MAANDRPAHLLAWIKRQLREAAGQDVCMLATSGCATPLASSWFDAALARPLISTGRPPAPWDACEALSSAIRHCYQIDARQHVLPLPGASQAITLAFLALRQHAPEGEVVVQMPAYDPLFLIPERLGFAVRRVDIAAGVDGILACVGARTAAIVWANPNNPLGHSIPLIERAALLDALASIAPQAWLIEDTAFGEFHTEGPFDLQLQHPRVMQLGSLSKGLGLGKLRCGWISWPASAMPEVYDQYDLMWNTGTLHGEWLAVAALAETDAFRSAAREHVARTTQLTSAWASVAAEEGLIGLVDVTPSTICFARIHGCDDTYRLAERLKRDYGVLVAPGHYFGDAGSIRIGYGGQRDELERGLDRLLAGLRSSATGR